ncbi:hypothetical protein CDD83_2574 [Cordyceps sp. RAO-2017]|nr:hypothetical protein CDD83_2574 [Cordyceps sp. RAO-2017]
MTCPAPAALGGPHKPVSWTVGPAGHDAELALLSSRPSRNRASSMRERGTAAAAASARERERYCQRKGGSGDGIRRLPRHHGAAASRETSAAYRHHFDTDTLLFSPSPFSHCRPSPASFEGKTWSSRSCRSSPLRNITGPTTTSLSVFVSGKATASTGKRAGERPETTTTEDD